MSGRASDATRAGPGPLEVSFTFQPGNGRNNGCRHTDQDRNVEPGNIPRISRLTALGDLSERARRRAGELANDADLRLRAPRDRSRPGSAAEQARTTAGRLSPSRDRRLPPHPHAPGWRYVLLPQRPINAKRQALNLIGEVRRRTVFCIGLCSSQVKDIRLHGQTGQFDDASLPKSLAKIKKSPSPIMSSPSRSYRASYLSSP